MKCEKCGKNEVNFHYSSNINGNVTQTNLCSECAEKMGYSFDTVLQSTGFLDDVFTGAFDNVYNGMLGRFMSPVMRRQLGFMPSVGLSIPRLSAVPVMFVTQPDSDVLPHSDAFKQDTPNIPKQDAEIDGDMQKRRELNAMREKMLQAAQREDYETAARLRDELRKLEGGGTVNEI